MSPTASLAKICLRRVWREVINAIGDNCQATSGLKHLIQSHLFCALKFCYAEPESGFFKYMRSISRVFKYNEILFKCSLTATSLRICLMT
jgi:hypothetical protein